MRQRVRGAGVRRRLTLLFLLILTMAFTACRSARNDAEPGIALRGNSSPSQLAPQPKGTTNMSASQKLENYSIGAPQVFENLTIFPVTAKTQLEVGPMTTLETALEKNRAEVRELGAEEAQGRNDLASAEVGTLIIENRGAVPIYVLAGTILQGGKQDRQVGQDFVVSARTTAPVDAFCVEQGRWDASRDGEHTKGRFKTMKSLATSKVRSAGQYEKDQSKVWSKVAEANASQGKNPESGTLVATLADGEVEKKQRELAQKVQGYLRRVSPQSDVVGFAYAVDGRVRSVRYFANHSVYALYRESLANTAAVDAITARGGKPAKSPPKVSDSDVRRFVRDIDAVRQAEARDTKAGNVNVYRESKKGYGSKTTLKPRNAASASPVELSSDYASK